LSRHSRTLRLRNICVTSSYFTGADVFRGESISCDEARDPTSLPYSPFVRGFPAFFHDYRDSDVTSVVSRRVGSLMLTTRTRILATV
jgi:hypothetical protein